MFEYAIAILVVAAGLFSIICAAKDYDWFMDSRKAKRLTGIIGRKAARIFYIVLGVVITCAGAFLLIGAASGRWVIQ